MCDFSKQVGDAERIVSAVIEFLDPMQKGFGIISNFIPVPNYLTSSDTFLAIKIIILLLAQVYILGMLLLHRMQRERLVSTANGSRWLGHHVRSLRPVCVFPAARIGRPPEANSPLCHMVCPSSREGK